jgi:hypothetical protein
VLVEVRLRIDQHEVVGSIVAFVVVPMVYVAPIGDRPDLAFIHEAVEQPSLLVLVIEVRAGVPQDPVVLHGLSVPAHIKTVSSGPTKPASLHPVAVQTL